MWRLIKSVSKSISRAVYHDPEMRKIIARYPRFFRFIKKRLTPDEKFGLGLTFGTIVTLIFIYFFFSVIESFIGQDPLIQSDLRIINLMQIFRIPKFNQFSEVMLLITYLGKWQIVFTGVIVVSVLLFLYKRWHYLVALWLSVTGGEIFVWLVKNLFERPRPPLIHALAPETSYSFPSGHTFVAFSFYGLVVYFLFRRTKSKLIKIFLIIIGVVIITAISLTRIYLGVHWPSDVLASAASGAAWLTAIITTLEIRRKFNQRNQGEPFIKQSHIVLTGLILFFVWLSFIGYYFLTHPLTEPKPTEGKQIIITEKDLPQKLFADLSPMSETITGAPMEPINIIIVGSHDQLLKAFASAGWYPIDPITFSTVWRMFLASVFDWSYPQAPGIPSFWDALPNDFALEKPTETNSVRERHHIHFWQAPFLLDGQTDIWFGTVHFDKTIKINFTLVIPSHIIDPAVDKERDKVKNDLSVTNSVKTIKEFQIIEPTLGKNQSGDQFFTDGKAYILFLK